MNWHDLILSEKTSVRYRRHAIFWIVWLIYFSFTFFYRQQNYFHEGWISWVLLILFKSSFILLGHAFICYTTIYFLLPFFLLKSKYATFLMTLAFSGMVVTVWSYFCYTSLFPILNSFFNSPAVPVKNMLWSSLLAGLLSSLKLVALAITIKLLKRWWLKQNENMQLEKEKINAELQLLKAQIHPDFLFSSLDKLYYYAQNDTPKASHLLLKLSDLLSYMLYECNSSTVPLEKEIKMLRNYLELEKNRLGEQMEADINLIGIAGNKTISPLLLLPFVESSFSYCENNQLEKYWINVELRIREFEFSMKLVNGKISDPLITTQSIENRLTNISRRLAILYKEGYELKITVEPDYMITFVKIQLGEEKILNEPVSMNEETVTQSSFTNYATV